MPAKPNCRQDCRRQKGKARGRKAIFVKNCTQATQRKSAKTMRRAARTKTAGRKHNENQNTDKHVLPQKNTPPVKGDVFFVQDSPDARLRTVLTKNVLFEVNRARKKHSSSGNLNYACFFIVFFLTLALRLSPAAVTSVRRRPQAERCLPSGQIAGAGKLTLWRRLPFPFPPYRQLRPLPICPA